MEYNSRQLDNFRHAINKMNSKGLGLLDMVIITRSFTDMGLKETKEMVEDVMSGTMRYTPPMEEE